MSVFEGGFADEQAAVVAAADDPVDLLDDLAALVDQSLVERDPTSPGVRFRLLETVRSFTAARLMATGAADATRRRHADAFLALAAEAKRHEATMTRAVWLERLSTDEANLRAAVRWCVDAGEAQLALRFVADLWRFWQADGRLSEGRALATRVLEMPGSEAHTSARMWALGAAGSLAYWQADLATTRALYEAQVELARMLEDDRGIADALFNLAHVDILDQSDATAGRRRIEEARLRYRRPRRRAGCGTGGLGARECRHGGRGHRVGARDLSGQP